MQKSSVNKVILVGHIGNKPEGKYTSSGTSTASFSLATNETWMDSDNKKVNNTEWHNIVVWNKLAQFANNYLFKGQLIYLEGKIHYSTWDDKDGNKKNKVEIICSNIIPLEWNSERNSKVNK